MGSSEEEIVDNLTRVVKQIVSQERGSRRFFKGKKEGYNRRQDIESICHT